LPIGDVGVRLALSRTHGCTVDGFLEPRRELHAHGVAALANHDLRRHVAPGDDDQLCHAGTRSTCTCRLCHAGTRSTWTRRLRSKPPYPVSRYANASPNRSAAARAEAMRSGAATCAR